MDKPLVGIVMGSDSDLGVMAEATAVLEEFGVPYEISVASAHRAPALVHEYTTAAKGRGIKVMMAAAGGAAHLGGVVAAITTLPVIAVPIKAKTLDGLDSLLSMVQMPPGIPVATVGINAAKNAGLLAVQILATNDEGLAQKLTDYKTKMASDINTKNEKLHSLGVKAYLEGQK
ncbi:MAG: 5-(carboxyamino)imidazole ribonucleotide mutase [Candidatus Pacebacteria bacterium]|nr:5-(carboxyamino)imidazole ribonucleotide mutase [Candidatus Paceibacterota bacterium]